MIHMKCSQLSTVRRTSVSMETVKFDIHVETIVTCSQLNNIPVLQN